MNKNAQTFVELHDDATILQSYQSAENDPVFLSSKKVKHGSSYFSENKIAPRKQNLQTLALKVFAVRTMLSVISRTDFFANPSYKV